MICSSLGNQVFGYILKITGKYTLVLKTFKNPGFVSDISFNKQDNFYTFYIQLYTMHTKTRALFFGVSNVTRHQSYMYLQLWSHVMYIAVAVRLIHQNVSFSVLFCVSPCSSGYLFYLHISILHLKCFFLELVELSLPGYRTKQWTI